MRKALVLAAIGLSLGAPAAHAEAPVFDYMGKASTGESVYYISSRAYCPFAEPGDTCPTQPGVVYQIGKDKVNAIADCRRDWFTVVWVDNEIVARKMRPQSAAIQAVLNRACDGRR